MTKTNLITRMDVRSLSPEARRDFNNARRRMRRAELRTIAARESAAAARDNANIAKESVLELLSELKSSMRGIVGQ